MNKKAIALMSGGLDSSLAVRLVADMGIDLIGVHFTGPFCLCNRGKGGCISYAQETAANMGFPFSTIPLGREYIEIVVHPKHGYGSGANPCIDCRILMFKKAKELMEKEGAGFIVTGEVLGQRPMSQLSEKLMKIERESGLEGLIVRPLCGKHMPATIPEKEGIIDRDKLLSISGRSRREQIDLADLLKVGDYPCPAGGCLLTDKNFARRVKDAIANEGLHLEDIVLLKVGRHFRLKSGARLVVGRDKEENERIQKLVRENDTVLVPVNVKGPTALFRTTNCAQDDLNIAASIAAAYCDGHEDVVFTCSKAGKTGNLDCKKSNRSAWESMRI